MTTAHLSTPGERLVNTERQQATRNSINFYYIEFRPSPSSPQISSPFPLYFLPPHTAAAVDDAPDDDTEFITGTHSQSIEWLG